jgi:hypothetical protein
VTIREGFTYNDLGIQAHSAPAMPMRMTLDSRIRTYKDWPRGLPQKPADLAEAGLYYTGKLQSQSS